MGSSVRLVLALLAEGLGPVGPRAPCRGFVGFGPRKEDMPMLLHGP